MERPVLKVGTVWTAVSVIGALDVTLTFRGYAPILPVRVDDDEGPREMTLHISARSIAEPLETLRAGNEGRFEGLRFRLRKTGSESRAPYEVESGNST